MKICRKCKKVKKEGDFYKDNSSKDGLNTICKVCVTLRDKAREKLDNERGTEHICKCHNRKFKSGNNLRSHLWRMRNSDGYKQKLLNAKTPDKEPTICSCCNKSFINKYSYDKHIWNVKHRGMKKVEIIFRDIVRRCKKRNKPIDIDLEWFVNWWNEQEQSCVYCKRRKEDCLKDYEDVFRLTIDRKDNSLGYVKGNLCMCCYLCNRTKSDFFTYDEMLVLGVSIRKLMNKRNK